MAVKIGHASGDERRGASGGLAGDQTGGELCVRSWYSSPWDTVLRPLDPEIAEKSARACEEACSNPNIGYDQLQRNSIYEQALKAEYRLGEINVPCECDCSSLMHVCAMAGGARLGFKWNCFWTGNMAEGFLASGDYELIRDKEYLSSDRLLKRGDILLNTKAHTAMVLSDGEGELEAENIAASPSEQTMLTALPLLKKGSSGRAVISMQTLLELRGYTCGGADGDFGPKTLTGLLNFQKAMGLETDGECGCKSWQALIARG